MPTDNHPKTRFYRHDIADALRWPARSPTMTPKGVRYQRALADAMEMVSPTAPFHDLLAIILTARAVGMEASLLDWVNIWADGLGPMLDAAIEETRKAAERERAAAESAESELS